MTILNEPELKKRFRNWIAECSIDPLQDEIHHFPEEHGVALPEGGAWIMVTRPPHAEVKVPPLSMWFARPRKRAGLSMDGVTFARHQAEIQTPDGSLCLWPDEYTVVKDISKWVGLEADGVEMHFMDKQHALDDMRVFYLQARGIPRQQALTTLLSELEDGSFVYFTLNEAYAEWFGLAS